MRETDRIAESCNDCGICVRTCMFLRHYCDSPKELAKRFLRNPFENIEIPYSCSLCGLCRRVCKQNLYPGNMFLEVREQIFGAQAGKSLPEDFVFDYMIPRLKGVRNHQIVSTSRFFTMGKAPRTDSSPPKRVFFPGCSLPAYSPRVVISAYEYLARRSPGIGIVLNCCGKPSRDIGDKDRFRRIFEATLGTFKRLGVEEVVLACINCHMIFRENSDIKLRTIYEILVEEGLPDVSTTLPGPVSVHDSCPARYQPEIRNAVRTVITRIGYEIKEMRFRHETTQCCGAGACAPMGNTAVTDRHTRARVAQAKGHVITYCAHCRERFSSYAPSLHTLDLVFGPLRHGHLEHYHDGWQNWLHRWHLKNRLRFL